MRSILNGLPASQIRIYWAERAADLASIRPESALAVRRRAALCCRRAGWGAAAAGVERGRGSAIHRGFGQYDRWRPDGPVYSYVFVSLENLSLSPLCSSTDMREINCR